MHLYVKSLLQVHDLLYSAVRKHPKLNFLATQNSIKEEWDFVTYKEMYDQCWKVAKSLLKVYILSKLQEINGFIISLIVIAG